MPVPKEAEQVPPHEIPAGTLVIVPLPVPALLTVNVGNTPIPLIGTLYDGTIGSFEGIVTEALFAPTDEGINDILKVQLAFGASVCPEQPSLTL